VGDFAKLATFDAARKDSYRHQGHRQRASAEQTGRRETRGQPIEPLLEAVFGATICPGEGVERLRARPVGHQDLIPTGRPGHGLVGRLS
jgi:hypothetical protein